jgi:thiaminase (transcriptional activator TenA)
MSWTQHMYDETSDLWERIYSHPFLQDIAAGKLSMERLTFYFEQNTHYIDNVLSCRSLAIAKAQDESERAFFLGRTSMIVDELQHQKEMLTSIGGDPNAPIAPTCHAYTRHILTLAWSKQPVEYLGAFMPCPWSYDEIGKQLRGAALQEETQDWWEFYMSETHNELCANYRAYVDKYSESLTGGQRQEMLENFTRSINYEYGFWDMAYNFEQWPLST